MNMNSHNNDLEFNISAVTGEGFDALLDHLPAMPETFWPAPNRPLSRVNATAAPWRNPGGPAAGPERASGRSARICSPRSCDRCPRLGRLTGRVDVEDILDVIFRDFCIGK